MLVEEWKPYVHNYDVSNMGRVRNRATNHILKQSRLENGYHICVVSCGSRNHKVAIRVHTAVAELFVDNPQNLSEVNHLDGDKDNNVASNLEWCTHSANICHAIDNGLIHICHGESVGTSVLSQDDIEYIRTHYIPRDKQFGGRALARRFNVHHSSIQKVLHKKTWRGAEVVITARS